jgi:hypothetical protein
MPMITLSAIPAMVALCALVALLTEDDEYATPQIIFGVFVAVFTYFAIYGLMKAVGL